MQRKAWLCDSATRRERSDSAKRRSRSSTNSAVLPSSSFCKTFGFLADCLNSFLGPWVGSRLQRGGGPCVSATQRDRSDSAKLRSRSSTNSAALLSLPRSLIALLSLPRSFCKTFEFLADCLKRFLGPWRRSRLQRGAWLCDCATRRDRSDSAKRRSRSSTNSTALLSHPRSLCKKFEFLADCLKRLQGPWVRGRWQRGG